MNMIMMTMMMKMINGNDDDELEEQMKIIKGSS